MTQAFLYDSKKAMSAIKNGINLFLSHIFLIILCLSFSSLSFATEKENGSSPNNTEKITIEKDNNNTNNPQQQTTQRSNEETLTKEGSQKKTKDNEVSEEKPTIVPVSPVTNLVAKDTPNDAGHSIALSWEPSQDEKEKRVKGYAIFRAISSNGPFVKIGGDQLLPPGTKEYKDRDKNLKNGTRYFYKIVTYGKGKSESQQSASQVVSAIPKMQIFNTDKIALFVLIILNSIFILFNIFRARRGESLYIRPVAGLEAVDEAVGRATEMGKPVLFVPGIMDMDNIQTIAAMVILNRVANKTAEYEADLLVPCSKAVVMTTAQEVVKAAYLDAGRPDAYREDMVSYLTDDQFGYAAGIDGIMVRERPAANFFIGAFYAESLILAETGASIGSIQVAGTAMPSQLPFFITACDYTLIGEELFAASAYLSKDPQLLGSLKGQDWGKFFFLVLIFTGMILEFFDIKWLYNLLNK